MDNLPAHETLNQILRRIDRPPSFPRGLLKVVLVLAAGLALLVSFSSVSFALTKFDFRVLESYQACSVEPDAECLPDSWGGRHAHWTTRYRVSNVGGGETTEILVGGLQLTDMSPGNEVRKNSFGFTYFVNGQEKVWNFGYGILVATACGFGLMLLWYCIRRTPVSA